MNEIKMNESPSRMISVRAIEDIIQIQKFIEDVPGLENPPPVKEKSEEERVVYSVLKHDVYSPTSGNNPLGRIMKECDVENSFKCKDKKCKLLDMNCWEGDGDLTKYINPEVVVLENIGILEGTGSEAEVKCWSSDSDITVLRVKKEFRNELSNKVEWEEQRNLTDDASVSSTTLDWESHSLINLAGVVPKEKDTPESLTPFTIWSKTNDGKNSSMVLMENINRVSDETPEVRLAVDNETVTLDPDDVGHKKSKPGLRTKFSMKKLFRPLFRCFVKKKSY